MRNLPVPARHHSAPALATLCLMLPAMPATAHPHIFIDTALHLIADDAGQATGIEVSWTYDEMYSMLLLDDMGLDPDFDGVLTEAELTQLDGYDLQWMEGFEGDLYASEEGRKVTLGPPESRGVSFENGKYTSRHYRAIHGAVPEAGLVLKAYDPSFYTAYQLTGGVTVDGDCRALITPPKIDEAYQELAAQMAEIPPDATDYPQVGEKFAETVVIRCGENDDE